MSRRIVGPFNRVEGDLEVKLDIAHGQVRDAYVVSTLYRGFEQMMQGKDPRDALVYAPRICGICSISQSAAAAAALATAQQICPPPNGVLVSNLIHATENIADHLTHFYVFFMPDFARAVYQNEKWYSWVAKRFKALKGTAARDVLPVRAEFMHIVGLLAGKWPHTMTIQPGGTTKSVAQQEKARLAALLAGFRRFLETAVFGDALETVVRLKSKAELADWATSKSPDQSDFRSFLHLSDALHLDELGHASDRFLSYGAYQSDAGPLFARGVFTNGKVSRFDPDAVREDPSHAWLADSDKDPKHPFEGTTLPDADAKDGYSWCKAPRLSGHVMEVGALARQLVDGHPLMRDLVANKTGSVHSRVVARFLEIARIVPIMESWVASIHPGEPFCDHGDIPDTARGVGLVEAARGSLGHWLKIKDGKIHNYQIIAPTTWNFSPRDAKETPGPLEQALKGAPIRPGEDDPIAVQHIVRSFDPCMVCTVH